MKIFRPLPLVPYYVQPRWIPLGPSASSGSLTVTAAADAAAIAGTFTATAALSRTAGSDVLAGAGVFTAPAALSRTESHDTLAGAGAFKSPATISPTEAHDLLAGSGVLTASGALARSGGIDTLSGAGKFTAPSTITVTARNDSAVAGGSMATTPALAALEQHDAMAAVGAGFTAAILNYLAVTDHFSAAGFFTGGPTYGALNFDPYGATFLGEFEHRDLSPIVTGVRTLFAIQAVGNSAAAFAGDDILTASVYPYGAATPVFSPATAWYTAGSSQSGWGQQQFTASVSVAQSLLLVPSIRYVIDVFRAPAINPSNVDLVATFQLLAKSPWQP